MSICTAQIGTGRVGEPSGIESYPGQVQAVPVDTVVLFVDPLDTGLRQLGHD